MPPEHAALPLHVLLRRLERALPTPNRDGRDAWLHELIVSRGWDRLRG